MKGEEWDIKKDWKELKKVEWEEKGKWWLKKEGCENLKTNNNDWITSIIY